MNKFFLIALTLFSCTENDDEQSAHYLCIDTNKIYYIKHEPTEEDSCGYCAAIRNYSLNIEINHTKK